MRRRISRRALIRRRDLGGLLLGALVLVPRATSAGKGGGSFPGGSAPIGTPLFPQIQFTTTYYNVFTPAITSPAQHPRYGHPVSGTVTLDGSWVGNGRPSPTTGSIMMRWLISDSSSAGWVPLSGVMTGPPLTFTWNTTSVADGTYLISAQWIDSAAGAEAPLYFNGNLPAYALRTNPLCVLVQNSGALSGAQIVPVSSFLSNETMATSAPDFLSFPGGGSLPIHNTAHPYPVQVIAPSSDPALRSLAGWYVENTTGRRTGIDQYQARWFTTLSGGVFAVGQSDRDFNTIEDAYEGVIRHSNIDGGRDDCLIDPYSNLVDIPAASPLYPGWMGVELGGRVYKVARNGQMTTIAGPQNNRNLLPYDRYDYTVSEAQLATKQTIIGTISGFGDFAGANDLVFDPRDSNILYVAKTLNHVIYRYNITTQAATLYAGQDDNPGYVDGPVAGSKFSKPYSIIMASSGIMYVADRDNSAIRTISADGSTVGTLCGGTVGPSPPSTATAAANLAIYAIASMVWNSTAGGQIVVVMSAPSPVSGTGQTVIIVGATNTGSGGNAAVNGSFTVVAFTDASHFTLTAPAAAGVIGTISSPSSGPYVYVSAYSPGAGSVAFASAYTVAPQVLRFSASGNIVLGESWSNNVRLIDLSGHTITYIGSANAQPTGSDNTNWLWLDVNSAATIGPLDDIVVAVGISNANVLIWRIAIDGSYTDSFFGQGLLPEGRAVLGVIDEGHYPWAVAISKTEGRIITMGFADVGDANWRILQPSDPPYDYLSNVGIDPTIYRRGLAIWINGTVPSFPFGSRPSFTSIMGYGGVGYLGGAIKTIDDLVIAYPSSAAMQAFFNAGAGGMVPRPELTGNDWRDLYYWIVRSSLQGTTANPSPPPGPDDPDVTPPVISGVSAVRLSATSIRVTWTTNKPTIGLAAGGSANSQGGTSASFGGLGPAFYSVWSPIEASYVTSHDVTVTGLPSLLPTHWAVMSRDNAGNVTTTTDATIS